MSSKTELKMIHISARHPKKPEHHPRGPVLNGELRPSIPNTNSQSVFKPLSKDASLELFAQPSVKTLAHEYTESCVIKPPSQNNNKYFL